MYNMKDAHIYWNKNVKCLKYTQTLWIIEVVFIIKNLHKDYTDIEKDDFHLW